MRRFLRILAVFAIMAVNGCALSPGLINPEKTQLTSTDYSRISNIYFFHETDVLSKMKSKTPTKKRHSGFVTDIASTLSPYSSQLKFKFDLENKDFSIKRSRIDVHETNDLFTIFEPSESIFQSCHTNRLFRAQSPGDTQLGLRLELEKDLFETKNHSWDFFEHNEAFASIKKDHSNFYSSANLPEMIGAIGIAGLMANTDIDQNILEHVQSEITFHSTDEYREFVGEYRFFGEGYLLVPLYLGSAVIGKRIMPDHKIAKTAGEWGDRSFRAVLLGTPPLLISQYVLGGSRPGETTEGSQWKFFGDTNAVSGHSFMGAVPFLTAAHMTKDPLRKGAWIFLSTLPALSRISENGHYPSQALLGWSLAYIATRSVAKAGKSKNFAVFPTISNKGLGIGVSYHR